MYKLISLCARTERLKFCHLTKSEATKYFVYGTKTLHIMPEPVGPINKTLLLSSSTASSLEQSSPASVCSDSTTVLTIKWKRIVNHIQKIHPGYWGNTRLARMYLIKFQISAYYLANISTKAYDLYIQFSRVIWQPNFERTICSFW